MAQVVVWQTRKFSDADFDTLVNTVNVWLFGGDVDQSRMFIQYMNNGLFTHWQPI